MKSIWNPQFNVLDPIVMFLVSLVLTFSVVLGAFANEGPSVRVKDISDFEGIRSNVLIGYGLVVGLNGTGDSANSIPFTTQSLVNMLERLGVNSKDAADQLKMKNVAAVMVTADMPALARQGSKIDVTASSLGDAKSLQGGMLLATPLVAADGKTYAVAQGSMLVGGFSYEQNGESVEQNHPTVARIAEGATVEMETGFELSQLGHNLRLMLKNPDFTTAMRVEKEIKKALPQATVVAADNGTVDIALPETVQLAAVIDQIENLHVQPNFPARVVIDEKTGTVVLGSDVRISDVAISHANLTIRVSKNSSLPEVPSYTFLENYNPAVVENTEVDIEEGQGQFQVLQPRGARLADLVDGLNSLGVKPRDIISILQNIKAVGALQAELVIL